MSTQPNEVMTYMKLNLVKKYTITITYKYTCTLKM